MNEEQQTAITHTFLQIDEDVSKIRRQVQHICLLIDEDAAKFLQLIACRLARPISDQAPSKRLTDDEVALMQPVAGMIMPPGTPPHIRKELNDIRDQMAESQGNFQTPTPEPQLPPEPIRWQNAPGGAGVTLEEVIEVCIRRLYQLNSELPCKDNKTALWHLNTALDYLNDRSRRRRHQGKEGTTEPHVE